MRRVFDLCIWAVLVIGILGTIQVCSDTGDARPSHSGKPAFGPGHPPTCPLCRDSGPALPEEIDEFNVHLGSA
jgi:hypothetical protein